LSTWTDGSDVGNQGIFLWVTIFLWEFEGGKMGRDDENEGQLTTTANGGRFVCRVVMAVAVVSVGSERGTAARRNLKRRLARQGRDGLLGTGWGT